MCDLFGLLGFPMGLPTLPMQREQQVAYNNYQAAQDAQQGSWWPELHELVKQYQPLIPPPKPWMEGWYEPASEWEKIP